MRKTPYADALSKGADDDGDDGDGPTAHIKTKAEHHEKMAALHERIADLHGAMSDHYKGGAKGAFKDAGDDASGGDDEIGEALEKFVIPASEHELRVAAAAGSVEARIRLAAIEKAAVAQCLRQPRLGDPSFAAFARIWERGLRGAR